MKMGDTMLNLYVLDAVSSKKVPAEIDPASKEDLLQHMTGRQTGSQHMRGNCPIKSRFIEKTIMNCLV